MNAYTIRYDVAETAQTFVEFVIAEHPSLAVDEAKERLRARLKLEVALFPTTLKIKIVGITYGPLCPYCASHAYRKCQSCETLMCGTCGGLEPICQTCYEAAAGTGER